ncbi:MAG: hypothetical protein ABIH56_01305 [Candidatus Margulisiibacteriota bacterium]
MIHKIGPRGQAQPQIVDLASAAMARKISGERKRLLALSKLAPIGKATLQVCSHPNVTFQVIAVETAFSSAAAKLIEKLRLQIEPACLIIESTNEQQPEVALANFVAKETGTPIIKLLISPHDSLVSSLSEVKGHDKIIALVTDLAALAQVEVAGTATNKAKADLQLLRQVAKDLAWQRLQSLNLKGQILILVSHEFADIFEPSYQPQYAFSAAEMRQLAKKLEGPVPARLPDAEQEATINLAVAFCGVMQTEQLFAEMTNIDKDPANAIAQKRQEALLAQFLVYQQTLEPGLARAAAKRLFATGLKGSREIYRAALLEELREAQTKKNILAMGNCVRILYENDLETDPQILISHLEWLVSNKHRFRAYSLAKWLYDKGNQSEEIQAKLALYIQKKP